MLWYASISIKIEKIFRFLQMTLTIYYECFMKLEAADSTFNNFMRMAVLWKWSNELDDKFIIEEYTSCIIEVQYIIVKSFSVYFIWCHVEVFILRHYCNHREVSSYPKKFHLNANSVIKASSRSGENQQLSFLSSSAHIFLIISWLVAHKKVNLRFVTQNA